MIFSKAMLERAIQKKQCSCEPTMLSVDGDYTLQAHQHEDGTIIINSFVKNKPIPPVEVQIEGLWIKYNIKKDNIFSMTQRGHDQ